jgi:hypothetical protein
LLLLTLLGSFFFPFFLTPFSSFLYVMEVGRVAVEAAKENCQDSGSNVVDQLFSRLTELQKEVDVNLSIVASTQEVRI